MIVGAVVFGTSPVLAQEGQVSNLWQMKLNFRGELNPN